MKFQTIILLCTFLFGIGSACMAHADVYKYEKNGKVYYTDSVPENVSAYIKMKNPVDSAPRLLYPLSYYPQPEPRHFPTGAVCWKTFTGNWECAAGRAANKIEVNVGSSGFPIAPGFGHHQNHQHHMKGHK